MSHRWTRAQAGRYATIDHDRVAALNGRRDLNVASQHGPASQRRATRDEDAYLETAEAIAVIVIAWCVGFVVALVTMEAVR